MGASQSSYSIDAVSEKHKGYVGQFRLNKKERYTIKVISELFEQLLVKNNLMDLSKLLSDQSKCNDLLVVSSRTLEDEFTRLRFPDPDNASKYISAFFWSKDQVERMQGRTSVQTMCQLVVGFLLRIVTLVAAITASIHSNEQYLSELTRLGTTPQSASQVIPSNEKYREPLSGLQQITARSPLNSQILEKLQRNDATLQRDVSKNIYRFKDQLNIAIKADKAVVFRCYAEKTAILGIDIEDYVIQPQQGQQGQPQQGQVQGQQGQPQQGQVQGQQGQPQQGQVQGQQGQLTQGQQGPFIQGQGQGHQGQPMQGQQGQFMQGQAQGQQDQFMQSQRSLGSSMQPRPGPPSVSTSAISYQRQFSEGGGKRRVTRRRNRRQQGGEDEFYVVRLTKLFNCSDCKVENGEFLINKTGIVFKKPNGPTRPNSTASFGTFHEYVNDILKDITPQFTNEDPNVRTVMEQKSFGGLYQKTEGVYSLLHTINTSIQTRPEGLSPANYRAFLLATGIDNGVLSTLFCNDVWSKHRFTNTIAYSLLNSLYIDRDDGVSESETRLELAGIVSKFVGEGVARPYLPASNGAATPQSFDQIAFPNTPKNLTAFCEKLQISPTAIAVRKTSQAEDIEILTKAHEGLRELQNKHIQECVNLMRKVLSLKMREIGQPPIIQLEETFFKNEQGARVVLETIIKEARNLISTHYLNVEIIYRRALQDLGRRMTGNYSPATAKNQVINTNTNRLNKAKNLLNDD